MGDHPETDRKTVGEELFLVHLNRCTDDEIQQEVVIHEDSKAPARKYSLGEELYLVHLKRSEGTDLDCDDEEDVKPAVRRKKIVVKAKMSRRNEASARVLQLRNRDVPVA